MILELHLNVLQLCTNYIESLQDRCKEHRTVMYTVKLPQNLQK